MLFPQNKNKRCFKKITEEEKKKELYKILEDFCEDPYGVILRTSAKAASEEEIRKECTGLLKQMHELMNYSEYKTRFSCLYREASFYLKYIRSLELSNFERIVTDLQSGFMKNCIRFMGIRWNYIRMIVIHWINYSAFRQSY